ncbi:GtrA family protein [Rhodococcus maanshanensis]|uniref:GtrA family protein n=1 Tax=Rhodococcus maanshanensis TaxID=183556 RepID=UPI0031BBB162
MRRLESAYTAAGAFRPQPGGIELRINEHVVRCVPDRWLGRLLKHSELLKFLIVGAITFVTTVAIFFGLKWTVLPANPVTANIVAVLVSTILSYILNSEWSFAERGGRPKHHEAALFFGVAGVGIVLNQIPLWISRYALDYRTPDVSFLAENIADFISGAILGTLIATAFRWWAMKRFVFVTSDAQTDSPLESKEWEHH